MDKSAPAVSVVVPVRNRRDLVAELLNALDKQTYTDFEVIVVDDGSTDGAGREAAGRIVGGRPVRLLAASERGAVAARTQGIMAAAGAILAFTDSDCIPTPGWLAAGVQAIKGGADVANGVTQPVRPVGPGERSIWSGTEGLYPTCNVFYRHTAFVAAGGFDGAAADRLGFRQNERARGLGFGEDTLLAWRVARSGTATFVPEAVVEHQVFPPDLAESLSRAWMAAAFPALVREVPELRSTLIYHRFQLGPQSRVPAYLTAGLLALGRFRSAAAPLSWWGASRLLAMRGTSGGWALKMRRLPAVLLEDLVTAVALIVGSIRARTHIL